MSKVYRPSIKTSTDRESWRIEYSTYEEIKYDYRASVGCKVDLVIDEPSRIEDAILALESILSVIQALRSANASIKAYMPFGETVPEDLAEAE